MKWWIDKKGLPCRYLVYMDAHQLIRCYPVHTRRGAYHNAKKYHRHVRLRSTPYSILAIDLGPDEEAAPILLSSYGQAISDIPHALFIAALAKT